MGLPARAVYRLMTGAGDPSLALSRSFFPLSFISYIRASDCESVLMNSASMRWVAQPTERDGWSCSTPGDRRQPARELLRLLGGGAFVRARKEDQELVAAPAEDEVRLAHAGRQVVRDELQDVVADLVPLDVVDLLEAVDVGEQDGERDAVAADVGELPLDDVVEVVPVVEAGERVADAHLLHLLVGVEELLHLRREARLARLEEQDDDADGDHHLEEHRGEVAVLERLGHRAGLPEPQVGEPHDGLLDAPEEEGRREEDASGGRAGRDREGHRRRDVPGGDDERDRRGMARRPAGFHGRPPRDRDHRDDPEKLVGARGRPLVAEPPHAPEQEHDVSEEREVEQEDVRARLPHDGNQDLEDEAGQEQRPGRDPVEERAAADLLVEQKKQQEQQDRPCRLNEQGELVDGHQLSGQNFNRSPLPARRQLIT